MASKASSETNAQSAKGKLKSLKFLRSYLLPEKASILTALAAICVSSTCLLGIGWGLRHIIDNGLAQNNSGLLDQYFFILLGIVCIFGVSSYFRVYTASLAAERVIARLRMNIYEHIINLSAPFFERTRTGELVSRLAADTTLLQSIIASTVAMALRNVLLLFGGLIMLGITSPRLTAYVMLMIPVVIIPIIIFGRRVKKLSRQTQDKVADLASHMEESITHIKAVQAFGLELKMSETFKGLVKQSLEAARDKLKSRALLTGLVITFVFSAVAAVLWAGSRYVLRGEISGGELSSFLFYSVIVASSVGALSELMGDVQRAAGAAERIMELLRTHEFINQSPNPVRINTVKDVTIDFADVTFSYSTDQHKTIKALEDFSLNINPGSMVALVGPSGAGKSTVFQLLLRFYDPDSGVIKINSHDIKNVELSNLRSLIGIVPQDPYIFATSAYENIAFGKSNASLTEVRDAARLAGADEFISRLPEGYSTYLGERGMRLSGGQKQRISIARAILKNPAILLLDEATSALDSENEHIIQQSLDTLMQGRTTLAIAHRLSTIIRADIIVVMDDGKIVATGKHHELLQISPLYARLASRQFRQV